MNVLPHLRCAVDPAAAGPVAGDRVPCLWLVDHLSPPTAGPDGCPGTGNAYASWRCDMRRFRDVVIDASQGAADRSLVIFNRKPEGGSGVCAWVPLAVRLGAGTGEIRAQDGCRERISCAAGYDGTILADDLDVVSGCRTVRRATVPVGAGVASPDGTAGSGSGAAGVDLSKCPGAGSGSKGSSPLYSVGVKPRGRRGMDVRVWLRRAVPLTVEVRVRSGSGTKLVRSIPRCGRKGANRVTVRDATGGRSGRHGYRVVVRSANSRYPLISSFETLPRG